MGYDNTGYLSRKGITAREAYSVRSFVKLMHAIGLRHGVKVMDISRIDGPYPLQYKLYVQYMTSERR